eukprot:1234805-Prymnesium_polylepis.1
MLGPLSISTLKAPVERHSSLKVQLASQLGISSKSSGATGAEYVVPSEDTTVAPRRARRASAE